MNAHYGAVKGALHAGALTYFSFLSFFPILAHGFCGIGYVAKVYPEAQENLTAALGSVLPGMVGEDEGQISLQAIPAAAGAVTPTRLAAVLYAGLRLLSSIRHALIVVFSTPHCVPPHLMTRPALRPALPPLVTSGTLPPL